MNKTQDYDQLPTRPGQPPTPPTMEVGKIEQLTTEKPPRTMPHTFARQEATIQRLQEENKALLEWAQAIYRAASMVVDDAKHSNSAHAWYSKQTLDEHLQNAPDSVKGGER